MCLSHNYRTIRGKKEGERKYSNNHSRKELFVLLIKRIKVFVSLLSQFKKTLWIPNQQTV